MWYWVVISSLLSGSVGVGISIWYYRQNENKRTKIQVLQQLLGNRYNLKGEKFTEAINQVFIVFHDCPEVLISLKAFFEAIGAFPRNEQIDDQRLLDLLKSMCNEVNIDPKPLTDNFFLSAFNIKK